VHSIAREFFTVRLLCVDRGLFGRLPTVNCHELMFGGAIVGCDRRASLAQTVSRTISQTGFAAPALEPVANPFGVNGRLNAVTKYARWLEGTASMDARSSGNIGSTRCFGFRARPFTSVKWRSSARSIWGPSFTRSDLRTRVKSNRSIANRAFVPRGCLARYCSISSTVQAWKLVPGVPDSWGENRGKNVAANVKSGRASSRPLLADAEEWIKQHKRMEGCA
jgi:hypothetical protein